MEGITMKNQCITPGQIIPKDVPDEVFEAFNELISRNFRGGKAIVEKRRVVNLIVEKINKQANDDRCVSIDDVRCGNWLKAVEEYKNSGWNVEYNPQEQFNDTQYWEAYFTFTPIAL
jgi:DUF2075 family protein